MTTLMLDESAPAKPTDLPRDDIGLMALVDRLCNPPRPTNVIDLAARRKNPPQLSEALRIRDEVLAECQRRKLDFRNTEDAISTAQGTYSFGMAPDRAIAAGKARAANLALGKLRARTRRPDDDGPRAA